MLTQATHQHTAATVAAQIQALQAQLRHYEVNDLIAYARAVGKCTHVVEAVWYDIGMADIAMLHKLVAQTPPNPDLQSPMAVFMANSQIIIKR